LFVDRCRPGYRDNPNDLWRLDHGGREKQDLRNRTDDRIGPEPGHLVHLRDRGRLDHTAPQGHGHAPAAGCKNCGVREKSGSCNLSGRGANLPPLVFPERQ